MDSNDTIRTTTCDVCHTIKVPCREFHHLGAPVLTACRTCQPANFEETARRDIDAWLAGGDTSAFGR